MWQGEALHPGDALTASPLVFLCFSSACLSAAEEDEEGEEGRREEGGGGKDGGRRAAAGRRRREARSQRPGVTLGQCPPVPGSGFKIAVVSFVQHEKKPQQSAASEEGNEKQRSRERDHVCMHSRPRYSP